MSPRLPEDSLPRVAISMEGRTTRTTMLAAARAMPIAIAPDWYDRRTPTVKSWRRAQPKKFGIPRFTLSTMRASAPLRM
jgi:hypothetical protein